MTVNFAKLLELLRRSLSPLWREVNRGSARSMLLPYAAPSIETIVTAELAKAFLEQFGTIVTMAEIHKRQRPSS